MLENHRTDPLLLPDKRALLQQVQRSGRRRIGASLLGAAAVAGVFADAIGHPDPDRC
jgi:hypothetical protein